MKMAMIRKGRNMSTTSRQLAENERSDRNERQSRRAQTFPKKLICASISIFAAATAQGMAVETSSVRGDSDNKSDEAASASGETAIEEIIVTGSHIRGVTPAGSPVITFDREEIEKSGQPTIEGFFRTLTQNFQVEGGGGLTSLDLRGLGQDATLVLVNGRRMMYSAYSNGGSDISSIPIAMVERIEVLTDGASALYGSDAVGGVVNIILRRDFSGAETTVKYGGTTRGDGQQLGLAQSFGKSWDSGSASLAYSYEDRDHVDEADRQATEARGSFFAPSYITPDQETHSFMLGLQQELSDSYEIYLDTLYDRDSTDMADIGTVVINLAENLNLATGLRVDLTTDWTANIELSHSEFSQSAKIPDYDRKDLYDFQTQTAALKINGTLFDMRGGAVRMAVGGEMQNEDMNTKAFMGDIQAFTRDADRTIKAVYGEVYVPLVGESNRMPGIETLSFSLAGRYTDYSNLGGEFVPKIGFVWAPTQGFKFRGTWGESYRAPSLNESLSAGILSAARTFTSTDPMSPTGTSTVMYLYGSQEVYAENSTNITFGFDFQPTSIPGLNLSLTYYDIDFTDKIGVPVVTLEDEAIFTSFITRRPADAAGSAAFQAEVDRLRAEATSLRDTTGGSPVDVIADRQVINLAETRSEGIDINLAYDFETDMGQFGVNIGGTYIIDQGQRPVPGVAYTTDINKVNRQVDFKLRNNLSWRRDNLSADLWINYVDSYPNGQAGFETETIDSWTTFDAIVRYEVNTRGWLDGTRVSLSALNLFDEEPPFVTPSSFFATDYDAANAGAIGRSITVSLTRAW